MGVFIAELIKIRRSAAWILAALVPSVTAVASAMGAWTSGGFEDGWNTLWIRSIGLYGMLMLGVGLSVLASLVWRAEHTGNNWNAMAAQPVAAWRLAAAKVLALALLATFMQAVLLLTVLFLGKVVFHLPAWLPARYYAVSVLVVVASVPVCAAQSALSARSRSFVLPVVIGFVLTCVGAVLLAIKVRAALIYPYCLLAHTTQLGSGSGADASALTIQSATLTAVWYGARTSPCWSACPASCAISSPTVSSASCPSSCGARSPPTTASPATPGMTSSPPAPCAAGTGRASSGRWPRCSCAGSAATRRRGASASSPRPPSPPTPGSRPTIASSMSPSTRRTCGLSTAWVPPPRRDRPASTAPS